MSFMDALKQQAVALVSGDVHVQSILARTPSQSVPATVVMSAASASTNVALKKKLPQLHPETRIAITTTQEPSSENTRFNYIAQITNKPNGPAGGLGA